jgi:hypothetical protein
MTKHKHALTGVVPMAKLYRTNSSLHSFCYALQKSEDIIIAAAYLDLRQGTTDRHAAALRALDQFWLAGQGLSDRTLIWINDLRRTEGQTEIVFVDGHSTSYSLARGEGKARWRRLIMNRLEEVREVSRSKCDEILEHARGAAKSLPARDPLDFAA